MKVSQAQIEANRRNSLKSTGPRTTEGKQASRANAIVHGLCASVCVPEDAKAVSVRASQFFDTLRPQDDFQCWLVSEISLATWKIDQAERIDRRVRDKIALKSELYWDDDKRLDAEMLGEQLGNRPAIVVNKLRSTPQGCEWLMARWALLAYAAESKSGWTPEQEQLAFDLLGTPADFRRGYKPGVLVDLFGKVVDPGEEPAAVARREVEALQIQLAKVAPLDESNRALAMVDLNDDNDAELKRVRRYEGSLHSRVRWCVRQLQEPGPPREIPRWLKDKWLGTQVELSQAIDELKAQHEAARLPEPEPVAEPTPDWVKKPTDRVNGIHAPFELEPHEIPPMGVPADFEAILANRQVKKRKKVEDLRDERRRQAKRLLA
jgi:hypothetical protein